MSPSAGFHRESQPSKGPPEKKESLTDEQIATYLSDHFEVPLLKDKLQEVAKDAHPKEPRQLRAWIVALEGMEGRLALAHGVPQQNIHWIQENMYDEMKIRREVLETILRHLRERGKAAQEAGAFIDLGTDKKKTAKIIEEIENLVYQPPPDPLRRGGKPHELYYKNNPYLPKFNIIDEKVALIDDAFIAIDRNASPEKQGATEDKLRNLKAALAAVERMDPIGAANHKVQQRKEEISLTEPASKAFAIVMGALAVMGTISIFRGKRPGLSAVISSAYGVAALKLWGVKFSGDDSELSTIVRTIGSIKYDEKFQLVVSKVTTAGAIEAAREFDSIMRSSKKGEQKKNLEEALRREKISPDFLENFAGKNSALVRVLNRDTITETDRKVFLAKLHSVLTEQEGNLIAVITTIENPRIYSINTLEPTEPTEPFS